MAGGATKKFGEICHGNKVIIFEEMAIMAEVHRKMLDFIECTYFTNILFNGFVELFNWGFYNLQNDPNKCGFH